MDKRIGDLQLENVENISTKQTAERELNSVRLRAEREQTENKMEIEKLQSEVAAVRSRLKFAEDSLVEGRRQNLQMVENVASLETDLVNEKRRRENAERGKIEEVAKMKEDKNDELEKVRNEKQSREKRLKKDNEQLEDLIRRQRSLIADLKSQCIEVTNKFEESYNSWKKEREKMITEMSRLESNISDLTDQREILETQNKEHGKLHEHLLNQIGYLEDTNRMQEDKLKRLSEDERPSHNTSSHSEMKMKGPRRRVSAITIERAGKVKNLMATVD